jgi:polyisoprenoid-binding protein YceI
MAANSFTVDAADSLLCHVFGAKTWVYTMIGKIYGVTGAGSFSIEALANILSEMCIGLSAIHRGDPKRDEHLGSRAFFFLDNRPNIGC